MKETFATRLKTLRAGAGLTQGQLADKAGCSMRAVMAWEGGHRLPSWESVCELARALNLSTDAFNPARK